MSSKKMKKILVVEDDLVDRDLLEEMLKMEKYKVKTASNRTNAENTMKKEQDFDLVIIDIIIPDASGDIDYDGGIKLAMWMENKKIKIPILMNTIRPEKEAREDSCKINLVKGFLTKDTPPETILEKVKSILSEKEVK